MKKTKFKKYVAGMLILSGFTYAGSVAVKTIDANINHQEEICPLVHILGYDHQVKKIKESISNDVDVIFSKNKVNLSIHKVNTKVRFTDDSKNMLDVSTYVDDQSIEGPVAILGIDVGEKLNIEPDIIETENEKYNNYRIVNILTFKK